jgi:hypothetical protein
MSRSFRVLMFLCGVAGLGALGCGGGSSGGGCKGATDCSTISCKDGSTAQACINGICATSCLTAANPVVETNGEAYEETLTPAVTPAAQTVRSTEVAHQTP